MLRRLLPLVLLTGCAFNSSPFVGKWEAILDANESVPFMLRAALKTQLPTVRLNMELRTDKTFTLNLPVVGEVAGTWSTLPSGNLELKVSSGKNEQMRGSLEGLQLKPSDDNKKLTLIAPEGSMIGSLLLFTRADGK
ncbi:MAG: hypothetical protein JNJ45_01155 [Chthonomonas sp.]|nr:hypothetical protein [Chthonomonas sp.]